MNKAKLKEAEERFIMRYPGGFSNPRMLELANDYVTVRVRLNRKISAVASAF
ncbi:Hypothetical protein LUCI_4445 [Lucifera butyrica]|uniref:Uncharacterized protein n=1 Tax=Lucifera butyrica TaxID=1351585 RepID=A0A498RCZ2_9FIRM|nr:hypothetical protein [Lucifera butyrica]VBB09159.1 Hypothetical protein LUCI_4445 [Lucifera butyrica]